jgi:hypothetical protein
LYYWERTHLPAYDDDDDDHADVVRLSFLTASTIGFIYHLPGDISAWRTMVELYRQGELLIRPPQLWQSYQESSSSKAGGTGEGNY